MLNQVIIVGRLIDDPKPIEEEKKKTNITLAVPRSYKNINGEYETDFIDCVLWNNIAENTVEYCKKGDLIGIKGRLETRNIGDLETRNIHKITELIAEKVTFLSSKKENENE